MSSPPSVPPYSEPCFFPGNVKKPTFRGGHGGNVAIFLPSDIRAELCKWVLHVNEPRFDMQRVIKCCTVVVILNHPCSFMRPLNKQDSRFL